MRLDKLEQNLMYVQMLIAENKVGFIRSFRSSRKRTVVLHATRGLTVLFAALFATSAGAALATRYTTLAIPPGFLTGVYTATFVVGLLTAITYRFFIIEAIRIAKELGYAWDDD